MALQKISKTELSIAISRNDFKVASDLLPKTFQGALEQPKVRELVSIHGHEQIQLMIEFELINLASLMSVGGNLNKAQVPFIAEQLIEMYPNESIADFKLCFRKGSIGEYGDIQRLDGITIGQWMKSYLDAKYEAIVNDMMKEKELYNRPIIPEPDKELTPDDPEYYWHEAWLENLYRQFRPDTNVKKTMPLTSKDIELEGQEKPKPKPYVSTDKSYLEQSERHTAWIRANFDAYTGKPLPGFIKEDEWLKINYK